MRHDPTAPRQQDRHGRIIVRAVNRPDAEVLTPESIRGQLPPLRGNKVVFPVLPRQFRRPIQIAKADQAVPARPVPDHRLCRLHPLVAFVCRAFRVPQKLDVIAPDRVILVERGSAGAVHELLVDAVALVLGAEIVVDDDRVEVPAGLVLRVPFEIRRGHEQLRAVLVRANPRARVPLVRFLLLPLVRLRELRPKNRALLLEGREILVPERIFSHLEVREIDRCQVVRDEDAPQIQVNEIHDGLAGAKAARINRLGRQPEAEAAGVGYQHLSEVLAGRYPCPGTDALAL